MLCYNVFDIRYIHNKLMIRQGFLMAFINEELTKEQQEEFNSWGITYPLYGLGQFLREVEMRPPQEWTVDKERKIYLLRLYPLRDYYEENVFIFYGTEKNTSYNSEKALKMVTMLYGIFLKTI